MDGNKKGIHRRQLGALLLLAVGSGTIERAGAADAFDLAATRGRYARRFPQPAEVGFLLGLPVNDYGDVPIGYVRRITRQPDGAIDLVIERRPAFGFGKGRLVAIPLEAVAIYGRQLASLELSPDQIDALPTWAPVAGAADLDASEVVRVALTKR